MLRKILYFCAGLFILVAIFGDSEPATKQAMTPLAKTPALTVEPAKTASLSTTVAASATQKTARLTVDPQKARSLLSDPIKYRFVTGSRVNFRTGPSINNNVLGQLSKGTKTRFLEQKGKWIHIGLTDGSNRSGWMSATYLSPAPSQNTRQRNLVKAPQKPAAKRTIAAPGSREISAARKIIIRQSIASYSGSCPCPYNRDRGGRRCGKRSAWSRPGGYSPMCYDSDITDARLATHFARVRGVSN
ncbi:MAG: SH3 domain-containing protein [Paracoccaceae bacterium]